MARGAKSNGKGVGEIDGVTQKVGSGEHTDKTYVEVLTKSPKYAKYLTTEGKQDRLAVGKFTKWAMRGELSIAKEVAKTGASE